MTDRPSSASAAPVAQTPQRALPLASSKPHPAVVLLTLSRPSKRNALSTELISLLLDQLESANGDPDVRCIVITGAGGNFSAGADLSDIAALGTDEARNIQYLRNLSDGMKKVRKPVLAAVEGICLGGGFELALLCDMIFASTAARFGLPEVKIGLLPGMGGTQRLTATMGKYKAMQHILLGLPIPVSDAERAGLICGTFPPGEVLDGVLDVAKEVADNSASAVAFAKDAVCRADALKVDDEFERALYYAAFGTDDKDEGVKSFLEKRKPVWKGLGH